MKHGPDTLEGKMKELMMIADGEHISWTRKSPQLKREMTIYPETLTPEQQERLNQIERESLDLAYKAEEETRTKTVPRGK
jgi:hypothetical protein